jgi:hypothetical protein
MLKNLAIFSLMAYAYAENAHADFASFDCSKLISQSDSIAVERIQTYLSAAQGDARFDLE